MIAELEHARDQVAVAFNHFENAENEYVDIAIEEIGIAQAYYNLLVKRYRLDRR